MGYFCFISRFLQVEVLKTGGTADMRIYGLSKQEVIYWHQISRQVTNAAFHLNSGNTGGILMNGDLFRCRGWNGFAAIILFFLLVFPAYPQTSRGTVSGTISDSSDAVIVAALAELTNLDTGVLRTTTTNSAGIYRFDAVDLGKYKIKISKQGFKTFLPEPFPVEANRTVTIDATLEAVGIDFVVEISEGMIETSLIRDAPLRGGTFAGDELTRIPFAWLDPFFAGSYPGVMYSGITYTTASGDFAVNGQRPRGNNYMLDGTDNNDVLYGGQAQSFKILDAVQESSSQTGNFGVEFGRAGGGVFNLITKSGTNEYHGTLSWRLLSQVFDAMDNLRKLNTPAGEKPKKPVYTQNIYGFTLGGPFIKNKTFFFAGFQQDSARSTRSFGLALPTEDAVTKLNALFAGNPRWNFYLESMGKLRGAANSFPVIMGYDPVTGIDRGTVQFATSYNARPGGVDAPQLSFRLDHNFNDIHRISFRFTYGQQSGNDIQVFPGYGYDYRFRKQNYLFSDSYTFGPTWTNEFHFSYSRFGFENAISSNSVPEAQTLPFISLAYGTVSAPGLNYGIPNFQFANKWLFQETQTKVAGRHTFRYGFEFVRQLTKRRPPFNERGVFYYQNSLVPSYSAFANYLDDFSGPAGTAQKNFGDAVFYPNQFRQSYFFQDTWKVKPSFTLTLGLRYENFGMAANVFKYPAFAGFDPDLFLVPNKVNTDNNNFGPSFGFAWSPRSGPGFLGRLFGAGKTVWRGGFQISYDAFFDNLLDNIQSDAPNTVATSSVASFIGRGTANFSSALPTAARPVTLLDQQTSVMNPDIRSPYTERWSFGFQRKLPKSLTLDLAYVGSASHKLFTNEDINVKQLNGARLYPDFGIRQIRSNSGNSNYHSMQLRIERRFARTLSLTASYTWSRMIDSTSEIQAGPSAGYSGAALTSVSAGQGGMRLDRGISDFHRSHTLSLTYSWDIPGPKSGILWYIAGGWTIGGMTVFATGTPYTVLNGYDRNNDGIAADRPDIGNPEAPLNTRAIVSAKCAPDYLNPDTNSCVTPGDVRFVQGRGLPNSSTVGRNTLTTEGLNQTWIDLIKAVPFTEGRKLEFRLEALNIFNHPQYPYVPSASVVAAKQSRFLNRDYTASQNRSMNVQLKIVF
jgi:hypothetical protein